jgi:hypothetical protein
MHGTSKPPHATVGRSGFIRLAVAGTGITAVAIAFATRNKIVTTLEIILDGQKSQSIEERFPEHLHPSLFQTLSGDELQRLYSEHRDVDIADHKATVLFPLLDESIRDNLNLRLSRDKVVFSSDPRNAGIENVLNIVGIPDGSPIVSPIDGYAHLMSVSNDIDNTGIGRSSGTPYTGFFIFSPSIDETDARYEISLKVRAGIPNEQIPYHIPTDVTLDANEHSRVVAGQQIAVKSRGNDSEPDLVIQSSYTVIMGIQARDHAYRPRISSNCDRKYRDFVKLIPGQP